MQIPMPNLRFAVGAIIAVEAANGAMFAINAANVPQDFDTQFGYLIGAIASKILQGMIIAVPFWFMAQGIARYRVKVPPIWMLNLGTLLYWIGTFIGIWCFILAGYVLYQSLTTAVRAPPVEFSASRQTLNGHQSPTSGTGVPTPDELFGTPGPTPNPEGTPGVSGIPTPDQLYGTPGPQPSPDGSPPSAPMNIDQVVAQHFPQRSPPPTSPPPPETGFRFERGLVGAVTAMVSAGFAYWFAGRGIRYMLGC